MPRLSKHQESWPNLHLRPCFQGDCIHPKHESERTRFDIQNHLHRFLPEGNHRVQPGKIEIVFDKILRNLAEIIMAR